jgi:hypothetical protein
MMDKNRRQSDRRKPGRRKTDNIPEILLYDNRKEYRQRILETYGIDLEALDKPLNSLERIREEKQKTNNKETGNENI